MSEITKDEKTAETALNGQEPASESATDAAFKRKVVAITVGAVVFLALLIILMCYQLIAIGVKNNRKNELIAEIEALEQQYEKGEETIEIRRKAVYIESRARELGYRYATDK